MGAAIFVGVIDRTKLHISQVTAPGGFVWAHWPQSIDSVVEGEAGGSSFLLSGSGSGSFTVIKIKLHIVQASASKGLAVPQLLHSIGSCEEACSLGCLGFMAIRYFAP